MAEFKFNDLENSANKAAAGKTNGEFTKIGFFKLDSNQECLVRFNIRSVDDFLFATVHKPKFQHSFTGLSNPYAGVSCLNTFGNYGDECPFCKAANADHATVDKVSKKMYVPMLVSYRDPATNSFTEPKPVIWERPAAYAQELATKIRDCGGDLSQHLCKITRTGAGKETRYTTDFAMPAVYKPELIPADFSAFNNFKVSKHSYWTKTAAEMTAFITTGSFPEVARTEAPQQAAQPVFTAPAQSAVNTAPTSTSAPNTFAAAEANPFTAPTQSQYQQPQQQPQSAQTPEPPFNWSF